MHMEFGMFGQSCSDLGLLVSGVVVHHQMQIPLRICPVEMPKKGEEFLMTMPWSTQSGDLAWLRERGIVPRIARRGVDSSERLGRYRWKIERALANTGSQPIEQERPAHTDSSQMPLFRTVSPYERATRPGRPDEHRGAPTKFHIRYERDRVAQRPVPAGDPGPWAFPQRAGRAQVSVPGHSGSGPDRQGARTMDVTVERSLERFRDHLRRTHHDHLRRTHHSDQQLIPCVRTGSTDYLTVPLDLPRKSWLQTAILRSNSTSWYGVTRDSS